MILCSMRESCDNQAPGFSSLPQGRTPSAPFISPSYLLPRVFHRQVLPPTTATATASATGAAVAAAAAAASAATATAAAAASADAVTWTL